MAFVLSSVSGNLISAASAGYAPTNSADVSAIASAYQVVSSTATQLYAGTAYLTGVNEAPISAARAGNAANASLASSAYYDGTGRFISALPDSAAVSSIASAYAEAAASGKLDTTAFNSGDFYSTSNPSGFITGVDLSEYATTGYVDSSVSGKMDASASSSFYPNDNPSGFITGVDISDYATTAMVDSAVSGKFDASASGEFYPSGNPSGFITGVDLSPYQPVSAMSAYQPSGDYYSASNPSGFITGVDLSPYQPTSAMSAYQLSGDYYSGSNPSGFVDSAYVASGLSGKEDTFSAGEGLEFVQSGSDRVLQVEAPVDIVAGPGIVIDNPDGNTLRVSQAYPTDETELWSGASLTATLSELPTNFERIRIEFGTPVANTGDNIGRGCIEVSMGFVDTSNNGSIFLSTFFNGDSTNHNPYYTSGFVIGIRTKNWATAWTAFGQVFGTTKSTGNSWFRLNKIVGIHRIASN